eukprot:TRINITY_DN24936_c0_g1_i1.p1 TRINITY_DN24936_c0_g1~~TRINITY_DN24936_c0_g1_i1.p1  ORF type:complete len:503 (+),score=114.71 TRINITY_DN24936_c0_g1_i1:30-1538(+)
MNNYYSSAHSFFAKRAQGGPNAIRTMFNVAKQMDTDRAKQGLPPLTSLGIGAPHIESNPIVDLAMESWVTKKLKLREKVQQLETLYQSLLLTSPDAAQSTKTELLYYENKLVSLDAYQSSQGTEKCRKVAADLMNHYYPFLAASARQCCICNSGTQALSVLFQAFVEPGVSVGGFSPLFPPYRTTVEALGGKWISIPTQKDNCRFSPELFEAALKEHHISLLVLNDPCNPSGVKATRSELTAMAAILSKPEYSHIIIVSDETYHDLVFSQEKDFFFDVVDYNAFKERVCIVLSLAKGVAGCPGLRFGIAYIPDMTINGSLTPMGEILGTLMLDSTCAVSTVVQYISQKILNAKLKQGNQKYWNIQATWEQKIYKIYQDSLAIGSSIFTEESKFPLVVKPEGAFFGVISGKFMLGKEIPDSVRLLDGRVVEGLQKKVGGGTTFMNDIQIANYLLHAAEVVTVPASGFVFDEKYGYLRISFAVSETVLREALAAMKNAAEQLKQ